jgi:hypothetical protein
MDNFPSDELSVSPAGPIFADVGVNTGAAGCGCRSGPWRYGLKLRTGSFGLLLFAARNSEHKQKDHQHGGKTFHHFPLVVTKPSGSGSVGWSPSARYRFVAARDTPNPTGMEALQEDA